ncbi:MAG: Nif3-like dinuclear metal center hexameric protein [Clostridia bacterium]|nr:Nif3-like dinuclear metal center hexameric protein [Clostridia bacterium]
MPKVKDVVSVIEKHAPLSQMLDFDSAGLNYGDMENEVSGIMLAQNVTYYTLEECRSSCCNLLITHHPSVFGEEIDRYTQSILDKAKEYKINLYSCHTNLDCCSGGLNDRFASLLGMKDVKVIDGCAREGKIQETNLFSLSKKVADILQDGNVKFVGDKNKRISKIAVCTGAGARDEELIEYAKENGVDCIIGGESKISIALRVIDYSLSLIDVGHYESEIFCVDIFKEWLEEFSSIIRISQTDVSPYHNIK